MTQAKKVLPTADTAGLRAKFPEVSESVPDANGIVTLDVPAEWLPGVVEYLRDDEGFNYMPNIGAVDWIETGEIGMMYHLYRTTDTCRLALRVKVPRTVAVIPSITHLFACADWNEREAFDLMGIVFTGHPNLKRLLMPENWVGHPLRKDYVQEAYELPCAFFDKKTTWV
jgi:NADH:ubiquinone oxidoreductase subunit C